MFDFRENTASGKKQEGSKASKPMAPGPDAPSSPSSSKGPMKHQVPKYRDQSVVRGK